MPNDVVRLNFDADLKKAREQVPDEGPHFTLDGQDFECVAEAPGGAFARLFASTLTLPDGTRVQAGTDLLQFFTEVIIEERPVRDEHGEVARTEDGAIVYEPADDHERLMTMMNRKRDPVPIGIWNKIATELIKVYTGRPI